MKSTYRNAKIGAVALAMVLQLLFIHETAFGCACGCGIFDVGTSDMLPEGKGGMAFLEYDFQDQNHNWSGQFKAPNASNDDKEIRTNFMTAGLQYFFNRSFGLQVEVPYDNRYFRTTGGQTGDEIVSSNWTTLGDIRIEGFYTGFQPDQSIGAEFGLKLPTGTYNHNDAWDDVDRDSELGTGSTDILLGGFYRHELGGRLVGFMQALLDQPVFTRGGYRPGTEFDGAAGVYYEGWRIGRVGIRPVAQILGSWRARDTGPNSANPIQSGYERCILSPGVEFDMHPFSVYADIEVPVWQNFTGNQLVAPYMFKVILSYHF